MKLKNLIDVANPSISFMLVGIKKDGTEVGYDFVNNTWLDNNLFTPEKICRVDNFIDTKFYKSIRENKIEDFGIFKGRTVRTLSDMEFYNGIVLKISIYMEVTKHSIAETIANRVKVMAERKQRSIEISRMKNPPKKKKVHSYKPNQSKVRSFGKKPKNPS